MDKIEQAIDELVKITWHTSFQLNHSNSYAGDEVYNKHREIITQKKMELIELIKGEQSNA